MSFVVRRRYDAVAELFDGVNVTSSVIANVLSGDNGTWSVIDANNIEFTPTGETEVTETITLVPGYWYLWNPTGGAIRFGDYLGYGLPSESFFSLFMVSPPGFSGSWD